MANEQKVAQAAAASALKQMLRTKAVKKVIPKLPELLNVGPRHRRIYAFAELVERAFVFVAHVRIAKTAEQQAARRHAPSTNFG